MIKFYIFLLASLYCIVGCKSTEQGTDQRSNQLTIVQVDSLECKSLSLGDVVTARFLSVKKNASIAKDTTFKLIVGEISNGQYLNELLPRLTTCDSVYGIEGKRLHMFSNKHTINFTVLNSTENGCDIFSKIDQSFVGLDEQDSHLEIQYGTKVVYDRIQMFESSQFKLLACLDTLSYELSGPDWFIKWELQNYPSFLAVPADSPVIEDMIMIKDIIPTTPAMSTEEVLDAIPWENYSGGLFGFKKEVGNGKALRSNHWVKIEYEVLDEEGTKIYSPKEPLYFYLGSTDVPKSWNYILKSGKIGDQWMIKANDFWGYGIHGLFPVVPAMDWYFYKIKVLGAQ